MFFFSAFPPIVDILFCTLPWCVLVRALPLRSYCPSIGGSTIWWTPYPHASIRRFIFRQMIQFFQPLLTAWRILNKPKLIVKSSVKSIKPIFLEATSIFVLPSLEFELDWRQCSSKAISSVIIPHVCYRITCIFLHSRTGQNRLTYMWIETRQTG